MDIDAQFAGIVALFVCAALALALIVIRPGWQCFVLRHAIGFRVVSWGLCAFSVALLCAIGAAAFEMPVLTPNNAMLALLLIAAEGYIFGQMPGILLKGTAQKRSNGNS